MNLHLIQSEGTAPITVLGIDFGSIRIGLAVGNQLTGTATPLHAIKNDGKKFDAIAELLAQYQVNAIALGDPCMDFPDNQICASLNKFHRQLDGRYSQPIVRINEAYSSIASADALRQERAQGRSNKVRKDEVDAYAAAIIVQDYFSQHQPLSTHSEPHV